MIGWLALGLLVPVTSTAAAPESFTYRDQFNDISFANDDGSHPWSSNWEERGENDGPSAGNVWVWGSSPCWSSGCMKIGGYATLSGHGAKRHADLTDVADAQLCFNFRRILLSEPGGTAKVKISKDGGANWDTLAVYSLDTTDSTPRHESFDLDAYLGDEVLIGFFVYGYVESYFAIDDVEVKGSFNPPSTTTTTLSTTTTAPPTTTTTTTTTVPPTTTTITTVPPTTTTTTTPTAPPSTTTTTTTTPPSTTTTTMTPTTTTTDPPPPPIDPPDGPVDISTIPRYALKEGLAMTDLAPSATVRRASLSVSPATQLVATMTATAATVRFHFLPAIALGLLVSFFVVRGVDEDDEPLDV